MLILARESVQENRNRLKQHKTALCLRDCALSSAALQGQAFLSGAAVVLKTAMWLVASVANVAAAAAFYIGSGSIYSSEVKAVQDLLVRVAGTVTMSKNRAICGLLPPRLHAACCHLDCMRPAFLHFTRISRIL
jgi:hypothetical protein